MSIRLSSSDACYFTVERGAAMLSGMVNNLINDAGQRDEVIPIGNVRGVHLEKVLQWCSHYHERGMTFENSANVTPSRNDILSDWDKEFIGTDMLNILEIGAAANYMYIMPLLHVAMKAWCTVLDLKEPAELRALFGIINPFPPEVQARIDAENAWIHNWINNN